MRNRQQTFASLLLVVLLVITAQISFAQGIITGSLAGTVVDNTGAIIPAAKITAKQVETNSTFTATTNDTGYFQLTKLPPGPYVVTVEAANFRALKVSNTAVSVAQETQLGKLVLQVGGNAEVVEVQGSAPLIETQTSQLSMTFDSKKVSDLPLGRGMDQLALYLPGVATAGGAGRGNNNGSLFSANGQRPRSNNFQIDGQGMNDPSVTGPAIFLQNNDIVAEYQVMTNYDAAYGRNTGSQVNVITKSGSNAFHGTAFETYRGSTFDSLANEDKNPKQNPNYCSSSNTSSTCVKPVVPRYVQNTFGGTVGGPIKKDKAWFFGSALWDRPRSGGSPTTSSVLTPTANGIAQIQSYLPNSVGLGFLKSQWGPLQTPGHPVVNQVASTSDPSGTGFKTIPLCVGGTGTACTGGTIRYIEAGQITRTMPSVSNTRQFTARGDVQLTSKDRLFSRYIIDDEITTNNDPGDGFSGQGGFYYDVPSRGQQLGADWTHQFSNNFLNQARFNWTRLAVLFQGGTTGCTVNDPEKCPAQIAISDTTVMSYGFSSSFPQGRSNNTYEVQDNANWTRGNHSFKFGGYWSNQHPQTPFLPNYNGAWTFATFSDFINNVPSRLSGVNGPFSIKYKENDLAFYFQDDIRLRPDFTLSLGLRWEWYQQTVNQIHDLTVAQQTGSSPYWNTGLPLDRTTIHHVPEDLNNFGPVVGFAWNARSKTVVRGGFRIAYDPAYYNILLNIANSAPVVNSTTLTASPTVIVPGLPSGGDFTGVGTRPAFAGVLPVGDDPGKRSQSLVTDNLHNSYSEQWNFGVQYELNPKSALEVRYLGNHSVGLYQNLNGNIALTPLINNGWSSVIPTGLTPCTTANAPGAALGYVDCNRTNVNLRSNTGGSNYNGLQTKWDVRSFNGLTSTLTYTWAHAIDNASDIYGSTSSRYGGLLNYPQNPFDNGWGERGNSNFDYRHTVGIQMIYEVPLFKDQKGILGKVLGGWQANTIYRYATGQPWTPIQSRGTTYGNGSTQFDACDPSNTFSAATSACRPILSNPNAPFNSVGYITAINNGVPTVVNMVGATPTLVQNVHWLVNNPLAAKYFGSPYLGIGRNTLKGQPTHALNFAMQKNFKITERIGFQFNATAFNLLNHMFLGVPGVNIMNVSTSFANYAYNTSGGSNASATENGLGRRRLQFGGKITF